MLSGILLLITFVLSCILYFPIAFILHHFPIPPFLQNIVIVGITIYVSWLIAQKMKGNLPNAINHPPMEIKKDGEWTVIKAYPAGIPLRYLIGSILIGGFVSFGTNTFFYGLLTAIFVYAWAWLYEYSQRKFILKPFAVKSDAFKLPNGEVISKDKIYQFCIKNMASNRAYIYRMNSMAQTASAHISSARHEKLVDRAYAIELQYSGKATIIAGGLTEALANAVFSEIESLY